MARLCGTLTTASILALAVLGTSAAHADTASFTTAGCTIWPVPTGVSSVAIEATGAAGETSSATDAGGLGDAVSAILSGLGAGQTLYVCVGFGGGAGPSFAGDGGGASGASLGSTFASPVLVAGGGGGAGSAPAGGEPGGGGSAGLPAGTSGADGSLGAGKGGGGGTAAAGGAGGAGDSAPAFGVDGLGFTASGPGPGGAGGASLNAGGGGGAGYYGGGGGGGDADHGHGGGGGGGGSDFCMSELQVSGCVVTSGVGTGTGAGTAPGDAKVILTYAASQTPPAPAAGEDPKCVSLRKKLKRQRRGMKAADTEAKRSLIGGNIRDTKRRLRKLHC